jgi:hypothetical protein
MISRNKRARRGIAFFFLANILNQFLFPSFSYALTNGPGQIEFTSFQSPGATDMVNPITGDFTYAMDLVDIPGPEGGFTLPLSYNAGIRPEQQASWVGLGWSMNAGSIARSMVQFPDDASGQLHVTKYMDEGVRGWYSSVPGLYDMGWNTETGHYGDVSIMDVVGAGWNNGSVNATALGVTFSGSGVSFDPAKMINGIMTVVTTVSTAGTYTVAQSAAIALATDVGIKVAASHIASLATKNLTGASSGYGEPTKIVKKRFLHRNYWIFVNENRTEEMYGSLYFQDMPASETHEAVSKGPNIQGSGLETYKANAYKNSHVSNDAGKVYFDVASDVHTPLKENQGYTNTFTPVSIASDYFSVMGVGVSGSIKPYRLDVGSVSYPKQMTDKHYKYNLLPFVEAKPQFRFEGSIGNTYTHHKGELSAQSTGISADWETYTLSIDEPILKEELKRRERDRFGLNNGRLSQGKHVEWFTNAELGAAAPNSPIDKGLILEFEEPVPYTESYSEVIGYSSECPEGEPCHYEPIYETSLTQKSHRNKFRANSPEKGIGGFAITAEDGTTYHYSLPVYQYVQHSKVQEKGNNNNYSSETYGSVYSPNKTGYATAWLLTAITGPDFVDRGPNGSGNGFLDQNDWGRWVKFEYGKFSSKYKWRMPYAGFTTPDESAEAQAYNEGFKETYYLNSISTRTHTALFIKDVRKDGRGHYTMSDVTNPNLGINERFPSSSLKLSEVVILNREDYQKLTTAGGIGVGIPAFSANMPNNPERDGALLRNDDTFSRVFDVYDIASYPDIRGFLNERALKRIVFNYTYELAPNTLNSFGNATSPPSFANLTEGRGGKLTLRSLSVYGQMNTKTAPDFVFEYGKNPAYHPDKWDGFGNYNRYGTSESKSHKPAPYYPGNNGVANDDAAAWSLTRVITPLGGSMEISYERDTYAHVSEYGTQTFKLTREGTSNRFRSTFSGSLLNHFKVGDVLPANFIYSDTYTCSNGSASESVKSVSKTFVKTTIVGIGHNYLDVSTIPADLPVQEAQYCSFVSREKWVDAFMPIETNGGDLRVREIAIKDDRNNVYRTRYQYTATTAGGETVTSGVLAQEPDFVGGYKHDFYDYFDYPVTPVMYSKVTVFKGRLSTDADYTDKTEMYFTTPHSEMISINTNQYNTKLLLQQPLVNLKAVHHQMEIKTSQIGQLRAIKRYNNKGMLEYSSELSYGSQAPNAQGIAQQGTFTEGAIMAELLKDKYSDSYSYKFNRTTKTYIPSFVTSVKNTSNGIVSTETNKSWDFYTGEVLKKRYESSMGQVFESEQVPAYHIPEYKKMGSKGEDVTNRHMLSQKAAAYVYKIVGTNPESKKLIAANVQTWNKNWNGERRFDQGSAIYSEEAEANQAWRKHKTYLWKSTELNKDGSLKNFVPFNWSLSTIDEATGLQQQSPNWVETGRITHYTRNSKPLQVLDVNKNYSAVKYGYDESQVIAQAPNSRYTEIAYSGAEDAVFALGTILFGGEVRGGGGQLESAFKHSGNYSLKVNAGSQGFVYTAKAGEKDDPAAEVETSRKYRASVWVHASDASIGSGKLMASLTDGSWSEEVSTSDAAVKRAGDWLLLDLVFEVPATAIGKQLTIACKSTTNTVYFDDFRFHPLDAPMNTNVYDTHTWQPTYTLDNHNLYVRHEYDRAGRITKTYREKLSSEGNPTNASYLVSETSYLFARMALPVWLSTGETMCEQNANGYTGSVLQKLMDTNTSSPSYGHTKWVTGGYSSQCPTCNAPYEKWINGACETGVAVYSNSVYRNGMYECSYYYSFSDGSQSEIFSELSNYPCEQNQLQ